MTLPKFEKFHIDIDIESALASGYFVHEEDGIKVAICGTDMAVCKDGITERGLVSEMVEHSTYYARLLDAARDKDGNAPREGFDRCYNCKTPIRRGELYCPDCREAGREKDRKDIEQADETAFMRTAREILKQGAKDYKSAYRKHMAGREAARDICEKFSISPAKIDECKTKDEVENALSSAAIACYLRAKGSGDNGASEEAVAAELFPAIPEHAEQIIASRVGNSALKRLEDWFYSELFAVYSGGIDPTSAVKHLQGEVKKEFAAKRRTAEGKKAKAAKKAKKASTEAVGA